MHPQFRLTAVLLSLALLIAAGAAGFAAGAAKTYVVRPGDSLWAISRADGLTVNKLAAANNMNPNDILLIGRRLTIPASYDADASPSSYLSSASTSAASQSAAPGTFCSTFVPDGGPLGVLPPGLVDSPARMALQPLFVEWADHYNLSLPLLEAIGWQESGWQQGVVSSTGAIGAGQIMPGTANFIRDTLIGEPLDINSVSDNIRMSAAFLAYLATIEGNNRCLTIAAYYEGPYNLGRYGVFQETDAYVASVEALIPEFE